MHIAILGQALSLSLSLSLSFVQLALQATLSVVRDEHTPRLSSNLKHSASVVSMKGVISGLRLCYQIPRRRREAS